MKRKSIQFTSDHDIHIIQSEASGKYWAQIHKAPNQGLVWEDMYLADTRAEALSTAEHKLDAMTEKWLEEGETE